MRDDGECSVSVTSDCSRYSLIHIDIKVNVGITTITSSLWPSLEHTLGV